MIQSLLCPQPEQASSQATTLRTDLDLPPTEAIIKGEGILKAMKIYSQGRYEGFECQNG
jgi:hypothetical protein